MTIELPVNVCARVDVSWDGSGSFGGLYDDVTSDVCGQPGLAVEIGKDGARALNPPKVSSVSYEVFNHTAKYSQENGQSPIYQLVLPGRPVRVTLDHGAADAYDTATPYDETDYYDGIGTYGLAYGNLDQVSQTTAWGNQRVGFEALGPETLLVGTTVTVGVMTNPRVDECITAILDAVGWPSDRRAISIADTRLTYWWCDDRAPWDAILELLASEGPGAVYVDGVDAGGTFHFENRNYRTTTQRCTESQASYFDRPAGLTSEYDEALPYDEPDPYDGNEAALYFTALEYEPGYKAIYNRATMATRVRALGATAVVWTYGAALNPPSGGGVTLIIRPHDPFQNAVVPVDGTDYTVSGGTVSVSLSASSGFVAFLTVTATSGTPTVTGLQLRAQPLSVAAETTVQNSVDASGSILKFSPIPGQAIPRVLALTAWPEILPAQAVAVCDAWVTRYMVERTVVTVEIRNGNATMTSEILRRRISDRVTIYERNTGLAADCWVNSKRLTIAAAGGTDLRAVLMCEKVDTVSGSRWDSGVWDLAIWGV